MNFVSPSRTKGNHTELITDDKDDDGDEDEDEDEDEPRLSESFKMEFDEKGFLKELPPAGEVKLEQKKKMIRALLKAKYSESCSYVLDPLTYVSLQRKPLLIPKQRFHGERSC